MALPTHATNERRRYATVQQAADHVNVGPITIRRLISSGDLTGYRLGKQILRVDLTELDALMAPIPTAKARR